MSVNDWAFFAQFFDFKCCNITKQQKQREGSKTLLSISIYFSGFFIALLSSVRLSFCLLAQFRLCLSVCKLLLLADLNFMLRERRYPRESTGTVTDVCCTSSEIHEDAGLERVWEVWNRSNPHKGRNSRCGEGTKASRRSFEDHAHEACVCE